MLYEQTLNKASDHQTDSGASTSNQAGGCIKHLREESLRNSEAFQCGYQIENLWYGGIRAKIMCSTLSGIKKNHIPAVTRQADSDAKSKPTSKKFAILLFSFLQPGLRLPISCLVLLMK